MPVSKSILVRDKALAKRNQELSYLRKLVGELKQHIFSLEQESLQLSQVCGCEFPYSDLTDICSRCGKPIIRNDAEEIAEQQPVKLLHIFYHQPW